ncbi:hypothetical protein CSV78_06770 [Sporosarcina sp. P16a]|uniref:hypothetical protein n=1 Tax=unclassified Sporosarcina TaxID=2647733 RepID=UPI000C1630E9|nr:MULTISPECIES: hypothetical protein [unclassified Sporosarcina]PIC67603.1 hypothetical protein CSV78_06770 [Sporosarcina sp. P16a]PIC93054.1 hypothetical protein CSV70_07520 [Sporosarcina sp. P25]
MKWIGMIAAVFAVMAAVWMVVNKSYYPSLPIENRSAKEVIGQLNDSDQKIIEIDTDEDFTWYITRSQNDGISVADEAIKEMISSKGWVFTAKEGSGLFFEKEGESLLVTTQMWTKKYVLVHVPNEFRGM